MKVEWEYKAFDKKKVELQPYQYESVAGFDDIVRIKDTGDYCRWLNDKVFEILYTASDGSPPMDAAKFIDWNNALVGKREDTIIMDDVYTKLVEKNSADLQKWMQESILYGTAGKPKEASDKVDSYKSLMDTLTKPSPMLKMMGTVEKENEMVIGGDYCHLCGAKLLQYNQDTVFKKRLHKRNVSRYECGTIVEEAFISEGEGYAKVKPHSKVILGDDCVEI